MSKFDTLTDIEKQLLKQMIGNEKTNTREILYTALGIKKKAEKKAKKNDPAFIKLLDERLSVDERYQSMLNGEFAETEEFQKKLRKYELSKLSMEEKQQKAEELVENWENWKEENLEDVLYEASDRVVKNAIREIEQMLSTEEIDFDDRYGSYYERRYSRRRWNYSYDDDKKLSDEEIFEKIQDFAIDDFDLSEFWLAHSTIYCGNELMSQSIIDEIHGISKELDYFLSMEDEIDYRVDVNYAPLDEVVDESCSEVDYDTSAKINDAFPRDKILSLLKQNPHYQAVFKWHEEEKEKERLINQQILETIPENVPELFPIARNMHRHFVLHVGPTNSGKTYNALEALKNAESGVYLAPLRLMAYETYETLSGCGLKCEMTTGEEAIRVPGANLFSMTIELLDFSKKYDVAVIDEAQMIADKYRGGAWTNAILGLPAREIHICMAPEAKPLICTLIEACGDSVEIHEYERKTALLPWEGRVSFPQDIEAGDACIVFSKAKVIACAAELQNAGKKCSVIYGDLPYETRHNEIRKFISGETDIIVSTDAIGMGMNVPIRRVVFLETQKFDGEKNRSLTEAELKQIAGRAGRFGIFDTGYYAVEAGLYSKEVIEKMRRLVPPITAAYLGFPQRLIRVTGKLSDTIDRWMGLPIAETYKKQKLDTMLYLAKEAEKKTEDKELVYSFATTPMNTDDQVLISIFHRVLNTVVAGKKPDLEPCLSLVQTPKDASPLARLEARYKALDLLYNLFRKFGTEDDLLKITVDKAEINKEIIAILAKQALSPKKCKYCGKAMRWNYPYGMCNDCHTKMYPPRQRYWDDDFDDDFDEF